MDTTRPPTPKSGEGDCNPKSHKMDAYEQYYNIANQNPTNISIRFCCLFLMPLKHCPNSNCSLPKSTR